MSKKLFSDEEINILSKNKYVKSVSKLEITYTSDFKILFIAKYNKGIYQLNFKGFGTFLKFSA